MITMKNNTLMMAAVLLMMSFAACHNSGTAPSSPTTEANAATPVAITKQQAIDLAQQFVKYQGYTATPVQRTMSELQLEPDEYASSPEGILQIRHAQILEKAFGARQFRGSRWAVGFEYSDDIPNIGRYVTMDSAGNNIKMEPKDIELDWLLKSPLDIKKTDSTAQHQ